jgi:predicted SprT family Zn-dependent metalloprotease
MQLDFFTKLTSVVARCAPLKTAPREVDPWQSKARELLRAVGCAGLAERVVVRWNQRMRSTAGTAHPGKSLVNLNPRLREFGDDEIDRTLRHELAHLLAHHRAGCRRIAPHGAEWRAACAALGVAGEARCHDLPLPRRKLAARHRYRCPGCGVVIDRVRPMRRRFACLACCRAHNRGRYDPRFGFVKVAGSDE